MPNANIKQAGKKQKGMKQMPAMSPMMFQQYGGGFPSMPWNPMMMQQQPMMPPQMMQNQMMQYPMFYGMPGMPGMAPPMMNQ